VGNAQQTGFTLVRALVERQAPEGGWPFTAYARQIAVEPTALALLALPPNLAREKSAAIEFLLRTQNPNGSWPAFSGDDEDGSGYTGLAAYALSKCGEQGSAVNRAVRWLLRCRGRESHWFWKWKFRTTDRRVRFDPDKFGWPWAPKTVSWVFPTAYSLLALKSMHGNSWKRLRDSRIRCGIEMLRDRVCPGGGWNAGNSIVYGSPLTPHPDATAVALLARLGEPPSDFVIASLDWLERRSESLFAPWSLAWTILALQEFKRPTQSLLDRLCTVAVNAEIRDCAALAVVCLALGCADDSNVYVADA
jgi:hypothetical protein